MTSGGLRRVAGIAGALLLGAGVAAPAAAQAPPNAPPAQGDQQSPPEHKRERGEKGQQQQQHSQQPPQQAPQHQAAPQPPPQQPQAQQPAPQPGPGPQRSIESRGHRYEQPPAQQPAPSPVQPNVPAQVQQAPQRQLPPAIPPAVQRQIPNLPPSVQQVIPQQQPQNAAPPQQAEPERRHRRRDDGGTPPAQAVQPAPVAPQGPPQFTPGQQRPAEVAPQVPQSAGPNNAQIPDWGFKRRARGDRGPQTFQAPERAALPKAPPPQGPQPGATPGFTPGFAPTGPSAQRLQDLQQHRTQRTEAGGKRTVIEEPDNRVIVRQDNRVFLRHDETGRLATRSQDVRSQRRPDGTTETVIVRPGGVQVYNIVDGGGRLVRRYRRDDRGREINIIDNRRFYQGAAAGIAIAAGIGIAAEVLGLHLGPPRIGIPYDRYIVDYDRASDDDLYDTLMAPPVDVLDRPYSLEEIRYNVYLRDRMRRIDLNTINFDFGSWEVSPEYYNTLSRLAYAINRAVDRNPGEVFLIEGHTDAVGSDIDNLSLSDRRAQSVAEILTEDFDVPPENLVTQGYGEEFLKIPTPGPERLNRRVAVRRITPLMAEGGYGYR